MGMERDTDTDEHTEVRRLAAEITKRLRQKQAEQRRKGIRDEDDDVIDDE